MKQSQLSVLEGILFIIGGVLLSLNFISNSSEIGTMWGLGIYLMAGGTLLTGLREKREGKTTVFKAHTALASGMILTAVTSFIQNIYTDAALIIGLTLISSSAIYIISKSLVPQLKNIFDT